MRIDSVSSCGNCLQRNKPCDGTQPICNTCIRDGQFCSGPGAEPLVTQPPTPNTTPFCVPSESDNIEPSMLMDAPMSMRRAISTIVATPGWAALDQSKQNFGPPAHIARQPSVPRGLTPDPRLLSNTLPFIMSQYMRLIERISFRAPPMAAAYIQQGLNTRLRRSMISFSSMFLGARIIQAMIDNFDDTNWTLYAGQIDRLYGHICATPDDGPSVTSAEGRLAGAIDLAGFKFITSDNAAGYALVRKATPVLIRVAYHYPEIWTKRGFISLPRAMSHGASEICNFVWLDNLTAMVLGTSPLLRYDTSSREGQIGQRVPFEWLYGCPDDFILQFARINTLRSGGQIKCEDGLGADRWQDIERDVQVWIPAVDKSDESRDSVARLAVHESWRHALLIYLYMGVCGVNSADPRVESSVTQIVQLINVVKHKDSFDRHLFVPCLLAGACARQESQRSVIERQLSSLRASRMWVLRSADFTSVLEHLWHGVGKDGRATTWDDYVTSRRAVLPVGESLGW